MGRLKKGVRTEDGTRMCRLRNLYSQPLEGATTPPSVSHSWRGPTHVRPTSSTIHNLESYDKRRHQLLR